MENIEDLIQQFNSDQDSKVKNEIRKYLKNWYWFLICGMTGVAICFFIFKNSPVTYEVHSRILVQEENQEIKSILSFDDNSVTALSNNTNIENKIGVLRSFAIFREALINLNWTSFWYQKELLYDRELYANVPFEVLSTQDTLNTPNVPLEIVALNENEYKIFYEGQIYHKGYPEVVHIEKVMKFGSTFQNKYFNFTLFPGSGSIGESYYLVFNNLNTLTNDYLNKVYIGGASTGSNLITVAIRGTDVQKEADFINELTDVFIEFDIENKNISSVNSLNFIDSQLARIRTQLRSAEEKSTRYRTNKQVINLSQEAQMVAQRLDEIDNEKFMLQLQIDYYNELKKSLNDAEKISEIINLSVVEIDDPSLSNKLNNLVDLYNRRESLAVSVTEKSPSFIMLQKKIQIARDGLEQTLENQLKSTQTVLSNTEKRYASVERRLSQLPEKEKQMVGIQREFDLNNELYTYLMQKRAEASISKASIAPDVQVIDPALAESSKILGPSLVRYVGTGLFAGVLLPFLVITFMSLFSSKIETREEIEKRTKLPVLEGVIKHRYKKNLPVVFHPRSGISESFRGLKSDINALIEKPGSKVISVNSLIPEEGKSFISSNLSATIARSNQKTLLIGADLHKPTLHNYLDIKGYDGLSDYFQNKKDLDEIILKTSIPNLHCIQAGPISKTPSDLFDAERFKHLIEMVRKNYAYIIVDNPPLMLIPDSVINSRFSDINLFVLRINHSHKEEIKQINKIVSFNKIESAAIVINETPNRGFGYGKKYWKNGYGEYKYKMSIA